MAPPDGTLKNVLERLQFLETLTKIPGEQNPADILTKYVERPTLVKHLQGLNLRAEEGRAASAPTLDHCVHALQHGLPRLATL